MTNEVFGQNQLHRVLEKWIGENTVGVQSWAGFKSFKYNPDYFVRRLATFSKIAIVDQNQLGFSKIASKIEVEFWVGSTWMIPPHRRPDIDDGDRKFLNRLKSLFISKTLSPQPPQLYGRFEWNTQQSPSSRY